MPKFSLAVVLCLGAALHAQSPLTTLFADDNGGAVGGGVYFDLTVNPASGIDLHAIDVNLFSAANTAGQLELWTRTGTHVGFVDTTTGWTLRATGNVLAAGRGQRSRCRFPALVNIPAGLTGIALRAVGVAHAYTDGNGTNQTYRTAEATLLAGSANNTAFSSTPIFPRVVNCTLYYGAESFASVARSGRGCNDGALSYYEQWAGGAFDLANSGVRLTPAGGGFAVSRSSASFVAPTSAGLGLTDDSLSGPRALGFTFDYPGGSTTDINICSNGFIHLLSSATSLDLSPTVFEALTGGPRLFGLWCDLVPDGAANVNNVFFEATGTQARVTWLNVPAFGSAGSVTMQVQINQSGAVDVLFQSAGHPSEVQIHGFSPGAANRDPGNRDLSAAMPFATQASDQVPLSHSATAPIIGLTCNLHVANITAGSQAGIELVGVAGPALDLTAIGMPTCSFYLSAVLSSFGFSAGGATAITPLPIPNASNLLGAQISVQAATISPGTNALGVLSSNLVTLTIGNS